MATVSLAANLRVGTGKGVARKLRNSGSVPGVVYSGGQSAIAVSINPAELEYAFSKTGDPNTLVELALGDATHLCLVKAVQRHPVSKVLQHIDFYEVVGDKPVVVNVPVRATGIAKGIKLGGRLQVVRRSISLRALPANIPAAIEIDTTEMVVGDFVKVSQIPAPTGCTMLFNNDYNVLAIVGKRGGEEVVAEDEEAAEAAPEA